MLVIIDDDVYKDYLEAVYDEDAVEGSLAIDNSKAAEMIRAKAKTMGSEIAKKKLATIVKALGVVLRRYHKDRTYRRNSVGGVASLPLPSDNTGK